MLKVNTQYLGNNPTNFSFYYTSDEVRSIFSISDEKSMYVWRNKYDLGSVKLGRSYYYQIDKVKELIETLNEKHRYTNIAYINSSENRRTYHAQLFPIEFTADQLVHRNIDLHLYVPYSIAKPYYHLVDDVSLYKKSQNKFENAAIRVEKLPDGLSLFNILDVYDCPKIKREGSIKQVIIPPEFYHAIGLSDKGMQIRFVYDMQDGYGKIEFWRKEYTVMQLNNIIWQVIH